MHVLENPGSRFLRVQGGFLKVKAWQIAFTTCDHMPPVIKTARLTAITQAVCSSVSSLSKRLPDRIIFTALLLQGSCNHELNVMRC